MTYEIGTWIARIAKSPPEVQLDFLEMKGGEELGRPFKFDLEARSPNPDLTLEDLRGETLTVALESQDGVLRCFNGHVVQFAYAETTANHSVYRLTLRPWLWLLTQEADCRIFQDRTAPEIISEILAEHEFAEFEILLERDYPTWDYRVQYRESTFAFISRLMEEEGIYYYFRHEDDKHVMVLTDNVAAHGRAPFYHYGAPDNTGEELRFSEWRFDQRHQPGSFVLTDFDYQDPRLDLEARSAADTASLPPGLEIFDYPGRYSNLSEGEAYARGRLEVINAQREQIHCVTSVPGLEAGTLFQLDGHPRSDQNREHLVVSANHEIHQDPHLAGTSEGTRSYLARIVAIPSAVPFRPLPLTPKAEVKGPQTAIVVGPEGQRIWTDTYGRVKVRFHWDRRGREDGTDSCWIRVSQGRAGNHWGRMELPHVGQEVIVDFLEGDPDRPIITGSVFNAANMPPLELPKNRYRTVVARDHFGNEIVFDGTPGDEHIRINSPHHNSRLVLGRSLEAQTVSEDYKAAIGSSFEAKLGSSGALTIGPSVAAMFGAKAELDFAPGVSIQGGHRRVIQLGTEETWARRDRSVDCHEDYVLAVHGAGGKLSISADDYRKTPPPPRTSKRSMLYLDQGLVQLSFGRDVPQGGDSPADRVQKGVEVALYVVLALAMLAEMARVGVFVGRRVAGIDTKNFWGEEVLSGAAGGVTGLMGIISVLVAGFKQSSGGANKSTGQWSSKVELSDGKLVLDAVSEIKIGSERQGQVWIGSRRAPIRMAGLELHFAAKSQIQADATMIYLG